MTQLPKNETMRVPDDSPPGIRMPVGLVVLLGVVSTLLAAWFVRTWESDAVRSRFLLDVADETAAIRREIEANLDAIRSVGVFYDASELVKREEFMLFTRPLVERRQSIEAIEWLPRVRPEEREAFVAGVRAEGVSDFEIRRIGAGADRPDQEAFPILYVGTVSEPQIILGVDLASEVTRRRALEEARDTGRFVATPPIGLVRNTGTESGFLVFLPVYRRGLPMGGAKERREALYGFVTGVFHPEEIIAEALQYLQPGDISIKVYDATDAGEETLLLTLGQSGWDARAHDAVARELDFAGRRWRVVFANAGDGQGNLLPWTVYGVLLGGGLLTLLAGFTMGGYHDRTRRIEREVEERTRDLRITAEALRESDSRMRSILDYSSSVIFIKDGEGRHLLINRRFEELFHITNAQCVGMTDFDLFPEQTARTLRMNDRQIMESGQATEFEETVVQNGEDRIYLSVKIPLRREDGTVYAVCGIATDITERKRAEKFLAASRDELERRVAERTEKLRENERVMATLLSNLPGAAYRCANDSDWTMEFISEGIRSLTGHPAGDFMEGRVSYGADVIHPGDQQRVWDEVQRALGARAPFELVYRIRTREGRDRWVWEQGRGIFDASGSLLSLEGFMTDMTELKNAEEAARRLTEALEERVEQRTRDLRVANTELEAFSYSVSHDLRSPLRAIDGFSQALYEDYFSELDPEGRENLVRIRHACQRMGHLIDDLLALSRVTRTELHKSEVNLSAMAASILENLRQSEPERGAEFVIEPGMRVQADPRLLQIALENLLGNAWKFTGLRATARIEVGRAAQPLPPAAGGEAFAGREVYFIRDNGAGFDLQYAAKLFGVFQRFHSTAQFPGTGIGLATVQRIIHRHGGEIACESGPDLGTTFYFHLG